MDTFWFWTVALALSVAVAAWLIRSLARPQAAAAPAALKDMQVYRDQLVEADRDLARGTLTPSEAARVKTEVARRLLDADRTLQAQAAAPARTGSIWLPMAVIAVAVAAAIVVYDRIGQPHYPDLPIAGRIADADATMAARPRQAEAEADTPAMPPVHLDADFAALMDKLRAAVDPATATDLSGLELLARNEAALGNYRAAAAAQRRLIEVQGDAATAEDFAGLAELMIYAAGGYISPEAEDELVHALQRDPRNGTARFFSGEMFAQGGRFDRAFAIWEPLLRESHADAPWVAPIRDQIEAVAYQAGVNYQLPEAEKGPSGADVAAAAEMSPEDRQAMIEGMVGQLQDRLSREGGSVEDWAKLINALGVLGRKDDAQAAYDSAKAAFAGKDADLANLASAAEAAGLTQ